MRKAPSRTLLFFEVFFPVGYFFFVWRVLEEDLCRKSRNQKREVLLCWVESRHLEHAGASKQSLQWGLIIVFVGPRELVRG